MFIKKMKNLTRYLILIFFVILTNNTRAEFFEDLSKIIENNEKRLSYGISVTDFNMDGNYEFLVTGFGYPNLALSFQDGKLKNLNQQKILTHRLNHVSSFVTFFELRYFLYNVLIRILRNKFIGPNKNPGRRVLSLL